METMSTAASLNAKMADNRFAVLDNNAIERLKEKATNINSKKSTQTWLNVWKSWAEERNVDPGYVIASYFLLKFC